LKHLKLWFTSLLAIIICYGQSAAMASPAVIDAHSFANLQDVRTTHLSLDLTVDFTRKQLSGYAEHELEWLNPNATRLIVDTRALVVEKVQATADDGSWGDVRYVLGIADQIKGQPLTIQLKPKTKRVRIYYHTTSGTTGLQWLSVAQTTEKKQPFLFSQSQAIHARSWIPLQDSPAVRITYQANIRTPKDLLAVMSADNSKNVERDGDYQFEMPQKVPAYLIALAVGDLHFKAMSSQTGIYAEKAWLDKAVYEFADTQKMIDVANKLYGQYHWGRYDLLILPSSFPFGGMENPRLSFITPTVITGDRSLVSLIAHELAHSWSGNLITNASWNDLWINEGFTNFVENRLMREVYGDARADMEANLAYHELLRDMQGLAPQDTALRVDLTGRDPDDAFSLVPYVKGQLFLSWLESKFGKAHFDEFMAAYFSQHQFQSMDTSVFLKFFAEKLLNKYPGVVAINQVEQWVYQPGIPIDAVISQSDAFANVEAQLQLWLKQEQPLRRLDTSKWSVHEWLHFINQLPRQLTLAQLAELDEVFMFSSSKNAEIFVGWARLTIPLNYPPIFTPLRRFLTQVGRTKFVVPLYKELKANPEKSGWASAIYREAKSGYHPLTQSQIDKILF
jgi:aminopeptidase N